jgi:hypothetical protein
MEKAIRNVEIKRLVSDGFKEIPFYITKDGKEFEKEKDAIKHENEIIAIENFYEKYKFKTINLDREYDAIFIEELTDVVKKELTEHYYHLNSLELSVGWNLVYVDDNGDYPSVYVDNAKNMIEKRKEEIKVLESLYKDYTTAFNAVENQHITQQPQETPLLRCYQACTLQHGSFCELNEKCDRWKGSMQS